MSDYVIGALITGGIAVLLWVLGRISGGARKDKVDTDATVATQWQAWAAELKERVAALEDDVKELKADLEAERGVNKRLESQNQRQASMLTALVRWAILLRDEVIRLGGNLPPAPVEVEAAMTNLDP